MITELPESTFAHIGDPAWLDANGLFVAEGRHVTRRLLQSTRFTALAVLLTPVAREAMADAFAAVDSSRCPAELIRTQSQLDTLTGFRLHQGCVALAKRVPPPAELCDVAAGPIVVLEGVRDPDNVGGIIRTATALGAAGLLLGPGCADPFYRKAVRTSMGAVFSLPIAVASAWPDALARLKADGRTLVALTPDHLAVPLHEAAARVHGRAVALLLGSEGEGLTPDALRYADILVRIPMAGDVDSLNVAAASAVALYALTGDVVP